MGTTSSGAGGAPPAGESTRLRLEMVAAELFHRQGYARTSVREILAGLGLTPGAMYNHFRSKEELLHAIASRNHAELAERLASALRDGGPDPDRQLWELTRAVTVFCALRRAETSVSRTEYRYLPREQADALSQRERRLRGQCEHVLTAGVERGLFRMALPDGRPADVPVTAKALFDLCVNAGLWFRPQGRLSAHDVGLQYAVLSLQAVGVPPADIRAIATTSCHPGGTHPPTTHPPATGRGGGRPGALRLDDIRRGPGRAGGTTSSGPR
ncbi:TetR/AcrR family transcriptional regulator [Streptomyces sparsus]